VFQPLYNTPYPKISDTSTKTLIPTERLNTKQIKTRMLGTPEKTKTVSRKKKTHQIQIKKEKHNKY